MSADDTNATADATSTWWDGDTPRDTPFHPSLTTHADRATEVALSRNRCEICRIEFFTIVYGFTPEHERAANIADGWLPGWDPPPKLKHFDWCEIGWSISTGALAVAEYWRRNGGGWLRMPELEGELKNA